MWNHIKFLGFGSCVVPGHHSLTLRVSLLASQLQAQLLSKGLQIVLGLVNDFNELLRKTTGICAIGGCGGIQTHLLDNNNMKENWFSSLLLSSTQLLHEYESSVEQCEVMFLNSERLSGCSYKSKILSRQAVWVNPACLLNWQSQGPAKLSAKLCVKRCC